MIRERLARFTFQLKTHALVWLIALVFAMGAYGAIHILLYAIRYAQKFFA